MKIAKSKTAAIAIAIFLMLSMSASMMLIPTASAHTPPWKVPTWAYIEVNPNPIGVGQQATIVFWLDKVPVGADGNYGDRWHGFTVTVTNPDGTTKTLGPYSSDVNGGAVAYYTPETVGTYKFLFNFPGQVAENANPYPYPVGFIGLGLEYVNDTYLPSSANTTLTVQQQAITTAYPPTPLPTAYWTRPINSMNGNWASLGGPWLGLGATSFGATGMYSAGSTTSSGGNFDPNTAAPTSAHIMWTKPIAFGGQIGGEFGTSDTAIYATGTAYEAKFGAVIINGILYYTEYPGAGNDPAGLIAVDLRTGATVWEKNITTPLICGMVLNYVTGDQYGAHAYLFCSPASIGFVFSPTNPPGNNWQMYDAMTGDYILTIANANAGTLVEGPNGEILSYTIANGMLTMWNSTKCIDAGSAQNLIYITYSSTQIWRPPQGATIDWSLGYQWSVPIATNITGVPIIPGLGISGIDDGVILATASPGGIFAGPPGGAGLGFRIDAGYSADTGQLLWGPVNRTLTPFTTQVLSVGEGKYAEYTQQSMTWICYDLTTGQKLWGPTTPETSSWAYYDFTGPSVFGYGNFYTWGLGGTVYCYNATTGNLKWTWSAGNAGVDTPYGTWPLGTWSSHHILADGMLYVRAGHDYTPPVFKGAELYCINATSGKEIWDSLSFDIVSSPAVSDGYMVWLNGYDNQIYCYGMGPSETSVTAPDIGVTTATPITITGSVIDTSAGSQQNAVAANFPHGLPCVSDASMSGWMNYVYEQQPMPTNTTGVQVTLTAIDPNHNFITLGTTTTDTSGNYGFSWTPPSVPGTYHITATFSGTNSYYGSTSTTYCTVQQASATPAPTATPVTGLATALDLTYGIVAAVIAIIIVGALLFLSLRKRP